MYPLTTLVITPTLGESPYLDETVSGVAALGIPIVHVISAPASRLEALRERYPSARVVADAGKTGGIYGALNAGLKASPAGWEWFTYINDDDLLLPRFGELVLRHVAQRCPEPVAYGDVELVREDGRVVSRVTTERSPPWIPALLQQGISPLMQQGMLFNRESVARLGGFDTRYRLCADLDFWLRAFSGGDRFRHYPLVAAQFRLRSGQLSSDTSQTMREQDEIVARLLPARIPPLLKTWARWRYRACNLPRYLERIRSSGLRTSYELLASGASPSK
jgi:glycosyltransferase involved in cell wall biosynthesis